MEAETNAGYFIRVHRGRWMKFPYRILCNGDSIDPKSNCQKVIPTLEKCLFLGEITDCTGNGIVLILCEDCANKPA
jgi:hypothetical protein